MSGVLNALIGSLRRSVWTQTTPGSSYVNTPRSSAIFTISEIPSVMVFGSNGSSNTSTYAYFALTGASLTTATLPVTSAWRTAASNGTTVIVGRNALNVIYRSTNGTSWTSINALPSGTPTWYDALWDGTRFLFTTSLTGTSRLAYSTDGTSWASINNLVSGYAIGFNGSSSYICTSLNSTTYSRCLNADPTVEANWATGTLPSPGSGNSYSSVAFGNGIWVVAATNTNAYATSTDGTTWTARTLPSNFSSGTTINAKMIFFNGAFYYYYLNNIYKSTDGINWTTDATFSDTALDNIMTWSGTGQTLYGFGLDNLTSTTIKPFLRLG